MARAIFGAKASSILLLDEESEELVFEAVVGEGEETLLGMRFPADHGHRRLGAGHANAARHRGRPPGPALRLGRRRGHGLRPERAHGRPAPPRGGILGVLEVLDRPEQSHFSLQEMDLLGLFANQAAIAVDLLLRARKAERLLAVGEGELAVVARLAASVDALEEDRREAGLRLLRDLADTLGGDTRT